MSENTDQGTKDNEPDQNAGAPSGDLTKILMEREAQLKEANAESASRRHEIAELKNQLKKFEGFDLDEFTKLKTEFESRKEEEMISQEKFTELLEVKQNKFNKELKDLEELYKATKTEYENFQTETLIDREAVNAASMFGAHDPELLARIVKPVAHIGDVDGKKVALVPGEIDPDTAKTCTVARFIELMADDPKKSYMFKPKMHGAGHGGGGQANNLPTPARTFGSKAEAVEFAKANPKEWERMVKSGEAQSAFKIR